MKKFLTLAALMLFTGVAYAADATLTWEYSDPALATAIHLERKQVNTACSDTGTWGEIGTTASDVFTFTDGSVAGGNTYCYRARAFNSTTGLFSSYSNEALKTVPADPVTPPPAPFNLQAVDEGEPEPVVHTEVPEPVDSTSITMVTHPDGVLVSWDAPARATKYWLTWNTEGSGQPGTHVFTTETSVVIPMFSHGYAYITSQNDVGNADTFATGEYIPE
jgi:hypothetical protein